MTFPEGAIVGFAPAGTPPTPDLEGFEAIGHVETNSRWTDPAVLRSIPADELLAGIDDTALTIRPLTREHTVTFTVQKVNRHTLRLLFGDAVPRSVRSLRRRRANLRRKRRIRRRHR